MSSTEYKIAGEAEGSAGQPPMMVHVVAPSSLPEGYTFEAQVGGDPERTFTVEVVSTCVGRISTCESGLLMEVVQDLVVEKATVAELRFHVRCRWIHVM